MPNALEAETFDSIKRIGYEGLLLDENEFKKALEEGPNSVEYTKLVHFLTNELRTLCNLDETVEPIDTTENSIMFIMAISSFLNELGCPYPSLTQGHVSDRLNTVDDRILLVEHLATELMAARIQREKRPEKKMELKLEESPQAADLRKILQTLQFSKPPPNFTMETVFQRVVPAIENIVKKAGPDLVGNPIFNGTLSAKQWETIKNVNAELHNDYLIRREMLLKRLDCTIQSFQWSDKTKKKDESFEKMYAEKRKLLKAQPEVDLSDLLASREDLAIIEKTSNASVRKNTKSSINSVMIGQVPDRGGRTSEQAPPPPEMPPWQQRNAGPPSGGYRGGQQGGQHNRGTSNYARGGRGRGQQNSYGSGGNRDGYSNYGNGNAGFSSGDSRGGNYDGRNRGSFDSAGSYGGNNYNRNDYSQGGGGGSSREYSSYDRGYSQGGNRGGGGGSYDSAGSYNSYSQEYQEPKRVKTYDDFQQNRQTYADQYVQENQHNQQYHSRDNRNKGGRGGRGRSNYNRGGGGGRNY